MRPLSPSVLALLSPPSPAAPPGSLLLAVRAVKNSVIGNRSQKTALLSLGLAGVLTGHVADALATDELRTEAAVALGSFAVGAHGPALTALMNVDPVAPLLALLGAHHSPSLVEAAARALLSILTAVVSEPGLGGSLEYGNDFQEELLWRSAVFKGQHVAHLVLLLSPKDASLPSIRIAQVAASIIAKIARNEEEQNIIGSAGAIPRLIQLLHNPHPRLKEAALEALSQLCLDNRPAGDAIVSHQNTVPHLLTLLRSPRANTRLLAASCLTNFKKTNTLLKEYLLDIEKSVLPCIIRLFDADQDDVVERAPLVLATLINDNETLQKSAMESEAIPKLVSLVLNPNFDEKEDIPRPGSGSSTKSGSGNPNSVSSPIKKLKIMDLELVPGTRPPPQEVEVENLHAERVKESALLALAAVSSLLEPTRKAIIDSSLLTVIVSCLSSRNNGIRAAACLLTRSLSRSVKNLRTHLVEAGVAEPLFKLLEDRELRVRIMASATLCNIVLDFSPMKKTVLESGVIEKLVALSHHVHPQLRLNSVWALKNLLFQADSSIKARVMTSLSWPHLLHLVDDEETNVQEQALNLLRNLACGRESDIEDVISGMGSNGAALVSVLERKLSGREADEIVLQTLYVIVNIATGSEAHKTLVMNSSMILMQILYYMSAEKSQIRVGSIWCIINLTWIDDAGSPTRVSTLRDIGFHFKLNSMVDDGDLDVKDRVKTALEHFAGKPPAVGMVTSHSGADPADNGDNGPNGDSDGWREGWNDGSSGGGGEPNAVPGGFGFSFGGAAEGGGSRRRGSGSGGGTGGRRGIMPPQMGFAAFFPQVQLPAPVVPSEGMVVYLQDNLGSRGRQQRTFGTRPRPEEVEALNQR